MTTRRTLLVAVGGAIALLAVVGVVATVKALITPPAPLSKSDAVAIALSTMRQTDLGPMPVTGPWKATFVELEPGREYVLHYPGNNRAQRAPCMRLFDSQYFPCSEAPIWYVHLETPNGQSYAAVVVDTGLRTGKVVQAGYGGMKPLPPGVTPFPTAPPSK